MNNFKKELEDFLNCACAENGSDTPDFILATYLLDCLNSFHNATLARDKWYGFISLSKKLKSNLQNNLKAE